MAAEGFVSGLTRVTMDTDRSGRNLQTRRHFFREIRLHRLADATTAQ